MPNTMQLRSAGGVVAPRAPSSPRVGGAGRRRLKHPDGAGGKRMSVSRGKGGVVGSPTNAVRHLQAMGGTDEDEDNDQKAPEKQRMLQVQLEKASEYDRILELLSECERERDESEPGTVCTADESTDWLKIETRSTGWGVGRTRSAVPTILDSFDDVDAEGAGDSLGRDAGTTISYLTPRRRSDGFPFLSNSQRSASSLSPGSPLSSTAPASPVRLNLRRFGHVGDNHLLGMASPADMAAAEEKQRMLQDQLFQAAIEGDVPALDAAIAAGADIGVPDGVGNYCLSEAVLSGTTPVVLHLLSLGADINCAGEYGRTPLWYAAYSGLARTMELLLARGAGPSAFKASHGELPLDVAANAECKKLLRKAQQLLSA